MMKLIISTPFETILETQARKVIAPTTSGERGLLPRHLDTALALSNGIMEVSRPDNPPLYLGLRGGLLVKAGDRVSVATSDAILSEDLTTLEQHARKLFSEFEDHERIAETAMAKLEAGLIRKLMALERPDA